MSEPVNVVRMTISVPKDLKKQMDAVKEPVNWSAEASRAFREKLVELLGAAKVCESEVIPAWASRMPPEGALLANVKQVCLMLGKPRSTIYSMIDRGLMPRPLKVGGGVSFRIADLCKWVELGCPTRDQFDDY